MFLKNKNTGRVVPCSLFFSGGEKLPCIWLVNLGLAPFLIQYSSGGIHMFSLNRLPNEKKKKN